MDGIWIEKSTNNGANWNLWNFGEPFYSSYEEFSPSLDEIPWNAGGHSFAAVIYTDGVNLQLNVVRTNTSASYIDQQLAVNWGTGTFMTPVVATTSSKILVVCNNGMNENDQVGLAYFYGNISYSAPNVNLSWTDGHFYPEYKIIPGTNSTSTNITIVADKSAGNVFHIAWQQGNAIKYCKATGSGNDLTFSSVETPSSPGVYQYNECPSISLANGNPVLSWTGNGYMNPEKMVSKLTLLQTPKVLVRRRGTSWGDIQVAGDNVNFTNNNSASTTQEKTVIIWSEGTTPQSKWMTRIGSSYSYPLNLSSSGIQAQVIGGSNLQYMTSIVFNDNQLPYYFTKTTTNFNDLGKISSLSDTTITFGRAGIVNVNGVDFVFNTGDVIVNDEVIRFIENRIQFSAVLMLN